MIAFSAENHKLDWRSMYYSHDGKAVFYGTVAYMKWNGSVIYIVY